jgi:hypothetical protein
MLELYSISWKFFLRVSVTFSYQVVCGEHYSIHCILSHLESRLRLIFFLLHTACHIWQLEIIYIRPILIISNYTFGVGDDVNFLYRKRLDVIATDFV